MSNLKPKSFEKKLEINSKSLDTKHSTIITNKILKLLTFG